MTQESKRSVDRRTVLESLGVAGAIGLAGCSGDGNESSGGNGNGGNGNGGNGNGGNGNGSNNGSANLVVGSGGSGSIGHNSVTAIQAMLEEESDTLDITAQTSDGWAANFRLYDEGQIDMSTMDVYNMVQALDGNPPFENQPVDEVQYQGMTITTIHIYMVARADSDIETYSDLAGKNVWPLGPAFGTRTPTEAFLKEAGLWSDMSIYNMDKTDVPGALNEGRLDAIGAYGSNFGSLSGWLKEVDARADLKVIEMDDEYVEALEGMAEVGHEVIEPYGWEQDLQADRLPDGTINTWLFQGQIAFGQQIPESHVYEFVKKTYENNQMVRDNYSTFPNYEESPERGPSSLVAVHPVHPGAAKFYQEEDLWNDEWEAGTVE